MASVCGSKHKLPPIGLWSAMRDGGDTDSGGGSRHVSRLQCIKEAVTRHLDHLAAERPNCQVNHITIECTLSNVCTCIDCHCAV